MNMVSLHCLLCVLNGRWIMLGIWIVNAVLFCGEQPKYLVHWYGPPSSNCSMTKCYISKTLDLPFLIDAIPPTNYGPDITFFKLLCLLFTVYIIFTLICFVNMNIISLLIIFFMSSPPYYSGILRRAWRICIVISYMLCLFLFLLLLTPHGKELPTSSVSYFSRAIRPIIVKNKIANFWPHS